MTDIPTLPSSTTYADITIYFAQNTPFIIKDVASTWRASSKWIDHSSSSSASPPNWAYLMQHYGQEKVSVVDCNAKDAEPQEMVFSDVIHLWREGKGQGLYIKDWHLARNVEKGKGEAFYETPDPFKDDWMNHYYSEKTEDDFKFVYFGTEGTTTGLHRDVYTSYSWSANILGRKRWHFIRPSEIQYCRTDPSNGRSPLLTDIRSVSSTLYPFFHSRVVPLIIEQEMHDVLFVPSNWYHFVENISPFVISINHNWCNSFNLKQVYESMWTEVEDTMYEMRDVKELIWSQRRKDLGSEESRKNEWMSTVQDVVRMNAGWNWPTFWKMVSFNISHPPCIQELRPPTSTVLDIVKALVQDFEGKHNQEPDVYYMTQDIRAAFEQAKNTIINVATTDER